MVEPKNTKAVGPVLPVMMSIMVVLPAPLADDAAQLAGRNVQAEVLMALKPSKLTFTSSR